MAKLKAIKLISKHACNCKGFYHPGTVFEVSDAKAADYVKKGLAEYVDEPKEEAKPETKPRRTKN